MQENEIDLLAFIVKYLVDSPDAIKIKKEEDDIGILLTLTAAKEDVGRIIGKEGRVASAIRMLLKVIGARQNKRVNLKIVEPDVF